MPNDPRHSRYVAVKGHTGTLVIDTHVEQPEAMRTRKKLNEKYEDFHFRKADAPSAHLNYIVEYGEYHTICSGIPTLEDAERIAKRTKSAVAEDNESSMYFPDAHSPIWGKQRNIAETRD